MKQPTPPQHQHKEQEEENEHEPLESAIASTTNTAAAAIVDRLILEKGAMNLSPQQPPPTTNANSTKSAAAATATSTTGAFRSNTIHTTAPGFWGTDDMERQLLEKNILVANGYHNGSEQQQEEAASTTATPGARMSHNASRFAKEDPAITPDSVVVGTNSASTSPANHTTTTRIRRVGAIPMSGINSTNPNNGTDLEANTSAEIIPERSHLDDNNDGANIPPPLLSSSSSNNNNNSSSSNDVDPMLSAMLVNEEDIVEAKAAPEGFEALVGNSRFRHLMAAIFVILLVVVILVAVLVQKSSSSTTAIQTIYNNTSIEDKDIFLECGTTVSRQQDYRGFKNTTAAGVPCQHWSSQQPAAHRFDPETFPEAGLSENYCRNPDGATQAWCYMATSGQFAYCDVPYCPGDTPINNLVCGTLGKQQDDYRGTINRTRSGKQCQRWDLQKPHSHSRIPQLLMDSGLEANYCRNPDGESMAWCYTMDNNTRWEYCNVPICEVMYFNDTAIDGGDGQSSKDEPVESSIESCGSLDVLQADYRGSINVTETGRTCQPWDTQEPHNHGNTPEARPSSGLEENFCRNPDGEPRAWCYTTDPKQRWEFCDVPFCSYFDFQQCGTYDWKQKDYRGKNNVTKSGLSCQPWAEQTPHFHYELPELMPKDDLTSNYCRNPTGDERAWCYTTSPDVVWEYCEVDFCTSEEQREKSFVCGSRAKSQSDYRGTLAVTESGRRCQAWNSEFPHAHDSVLPEQEPVLQENYCRNPDGKDRAWCYTTAVIREKFEYCSVPYCEDME